MQRSTILSGAADAAMAVRKACNGIKRMSTITVATMVAGVDAKEAVAASHGMAMAVLKSIGFDIDNAERVDAVLPMVLEATSTVLADAARHSKSWKFGGEELEKAASAGVATMSAVAKSRAIARMIEPGWPADIDTTTALRLAAASAMTQVAVEVSVFDFMHPQADCIKEAGRIVVKAATEAARDLAPPQSSSAARLMLTQNMIQSAARLYAAAWRAAAADQVAELDALSDAACDARLQAMEKASLTELLAPVAKRFHEAFGAVAGMAAEMFAGNEPSAAPSAAESQPHLSASTGRPRRVR
jgi:hypothetical protein